MMSKKQREAMTLAALGNFKSTLKRQPAAAAGDGDGDGGDGDGDGDGGNASLTVHKLKFLRNTAAAEGAEYDAHDPLKHGADASRAAAKIEQRKREQMSMKGEF